MRACEEGRCKTASEGLYVDFDVDEVGGVGADGLADERARGEVGVAEDGFEMRGDLPAGAEVEFLADAAAAAAGGVADGGGEEAVASAGEGVPVPAGVDAELAVRCDFETDLGGADVFEAGVFAGGPWPGEAVEAFEALVFGVVRIAVAGGVAVEGAEAGLPWEGEAVAEFGGGAEGGEGTVAGVAGLDDDVGVPVEAGVADDAVGAEAWGVDDVFLGGAGGGLAEGEVERVEGSDVRPAAPVADGSEEPLPVDGFVGLVHAAGEGLDGEEVELPVVDFRAEGAVEAEEGVGGVAPLVVSDEAAVEEFEVMDAPAEEGWAGVAFGVVTEEIGVVEFGVEPDDFPFVDVTVVFGPLTVPAAGVGDFDGEAEGVENVVDSGVEAGAVEERFVGAGGGAADVVVAVFEADAVVEAEVEP